MNNPLITGIVLSALVCAAHAGNKKLMANAETELRNVNEKVLQKVPQDQVPKTGRIKVTADVKTTKPEPVITNILLKTISSNPTVKPKID